jgi:preprotein translocase subunit SecG
MNFLTKLKWILGILLIFFVIVATNLVDRNSFSLVKESVATIYEDRLVAKNLIFNMYKVLQEKKLNAVTAKPFATTELAGQQKELNLLVDRFDKTKLTREEGVIYTDFKTELENLFALEKNEKVMEVDNAAYLKQLSVLERSLNQLANIQLEEGNRQVSISRKALNTVDLFTKIEIYLLIILAVIIQVIIMYNPKKEDRDNLRVS